jgi:hypothetical protein
MPRVGLGEPVGGVAQVHGGEHVVNPAAALSAGHVEQAGEQGHVLPSREAGVGRQLLGHVADQAPGREGLLHDVVAEDIDAAPVRRQQGGQDADGRRLAGAVGPEQAGRSPFGHVEVDAVDGHERTKALAQLVDADGERPGGGHASASPLAWSAGQVAQGADGGPDTAPVVGVEAASAWLSTSACSWRHRWTRARPATGGRARRPGGRPDRRCAR